MKYRHPENDGAGDWQEQVYQMVKSMKDAYFLQLNEVYLKTATKLQQFDAHPQPRSEYINKLKFVKAEAERLMQFLQLSKNEIQIEHKTKLPSLEALIRKVLRLGS